MQAWEWALELRTETLEWWQSKIGRDYGHGWSSIRSKGQHLMKDIADIETMKLSIASPFYVTNEMCDLLFHAQKTFPKTALYAADLPSDTGFVFLAKPVEVTDIHLDRLPWQAFAWGLASGSVNPEEARGIHLSVYAHRDTDPGRPEAQRKTGLTFPTLALTHETAWTFDSTYGDADAWRGGTIFSENIEVPEESKESSLEMLRLMHTFFILSMQKIATPENMRASRGVRKRAFRSDPNRPIPEVRVVQLRRRRPKRESDEKLGGGREYSHRWWVNGFWRRQWYPSEGRHKPKYIADYVKGPEDKPLVLKDTAYIWRR